MPHTKTVALKGEALRIFQDYDARREAIRVQIENLLAGDDLARDAMFRALGTELGLDLKNFHWQIDEGHREEFGVVLLRGQGHNLPTMGAGGEDARSDNDGVLAGGGGDRGPVRPRAH